MLGVEEPLVMHLRPHCKDGGLAEFLLRMRLRRRGARVIKQQQAGEIVKTMLKPESADSFRDFVKEVAERRVGAEHRSAQLDSPGRPVLSPDNIFTISTGTPPATFNLVLARLLGARSITNMTPSLLPLRHFDAAVLPEHDLHSNFRMASNTLVTPLALGYHDELQAHFLAQQLAAEYGFEPAGRYVGLALGGPSKRSFWNPAFMLEWLEDLLEHSSASGSKLLATNSRRTPQWCTDWLKKQRASGRIAAFVDAFEDSRNPLPAFYELCWQIHVSADSISMISEAVQAGHRPVVHGTSWRGPGGKLRSFISTLSSGGDVFMNAAALPDESLRREDRINASYERLRQQLLELLGCKAD
jgi:mitochondrial fission protein ELM1